MKCGYLKGDIGRVIYATYDKILATFVGMIINKDSWILKSPPK